MRVNFVTAAIITCVLLTIFNAVIHQVRDGDPELIDSAMNGLVVGISVTTVQYWMAKRKEATSNSSSEE